jgi:hypothetical protein
LLRGLREGMAPLFRIVQWQKTIWNTASSSFLSL